MTLIQQSMTAAALALGLIVAATPLSVATPAQAQTAAPAAGDRGATLFRQRCGSCHSVAPGVRSPQGPHLAGVVGRRAGTAPGYNYSRGMLAADRTWTAATLDVYLTAPGRAVPGTRMMTAVANPADRAAIVAYLATQRAPR